MSFFKRFLPRQMGSGKLWDNVNSGGTAIKAPQTTVASNATMYPYENYFVPGPNPEPYLKTAAWKDPQRLHSPYAHQIPPFPVRDPVGINQGVYNQPELTPGSSGQPTVQGRALPTVALAPSQVRYRERGLNSATPWQSPYDAGDPRVLRTPQAYTPSQRYFNERVPLPEYTTPSVPAHMVYTTIPVMRAGWAQSIVPEPGMRINEVGTAAPWHLSTPLNVKTVVAMNGPLADTKRIPYKNLKAPKRERTGG